MEIITNLFLFLLSAIFISLSGVMIPGPVFAATIAKGYVSKIAGALIAFGHGIIEFPLMVLIYFGFTRFFVHCTIKMFIGLFGGLMLMFMGVKMFKTRGKILETGKGPERGSFIAGIITTGSNPYFFSWWATIGATLVMNSAIFGVIGFLLFAIAHWLCDFLWYFFVSMTVFKLRRFWGKKVHEIIFGFCSMALMGFGAWFFVSVLL